MRVGVVILPEQRWADARQRWRQAEELGFDHAWTYDHLGWRELVDGPWFDAVPTLTAAAAVTSRIRLGTFVASPNFRHPVPFARAVTALDDISAGRLLLGLGAGGLGFDAVVLGGPELTARQRMDRFAEFVEVLDRVLSGRRTSWRGEYFTAVDARSDPGCVQRPRVPFVVAANGPRGLRLAARFGQGWVTTGTRRDGPAGWWASVAELAARFEEALGAAGRSPGTVDRYLSLDAGPVYSLLSRQVFADAAGRAGELGFTDVVIHWPRPAGWYASRPEVLAEVAEMLPELRRH